MSKIDSLPRIICISTDDSDARINNFRDQCISYGITNYEIYSFPRFDASLFTLTGEYLYKLNNNSKGPITSHVKALKKWYEAYDDDIILVMEDDVNLKTIDYWNFTWHDFIDNLPKDWDCVQLCLIKESLDNININIHKRLNNDFGCQAYLMTRNYAKKIIDKYYIDDYCFNFDIGNINIQIEENKYGYYNLFPIIENVLFESIGTVYNFPLFTEDIINTSSSFKEDILASNDQYHIASYKYIIEWWKNTGKYKTLKDLNKIAYQTPITVVQIGAHKGNDDLYRHICSNYKDLNLGLFVEANPSHIDELKKCYSRFNNIAIENIAIKYFKDNSNKLKIFYHDHDPDKQVASANIEHVKKHQIFWPEGGDIQSFEINSFNLHQLLDKYNLKTIDWLLLDVEGMESSIIIDLDFSKYKIKKLEFEALHLEKQKDKIIDKLTKLGYIQVPALHEYDIAFKLLDNIFDRYATDPENTGLNIELADYYFSKGHTGSAFTHYLRAAERAEEPNISYKCLIMGYKCFNQQKNRDFTSSHLLKQAIAINPKRPEAYFYLSKFYEEKQSWYDSYTYASIGLEMCDDDSESLNLENYPIKIGLLFNKAVAAYWWDKMDESRKLFNYILEQYDNIPSFYLSTIEYNLTEIEKKRQIHKIYTKDQHNRLKFKFDGSEIIEKNYSQAFQDIFCLIATNGKHDGTYLEIGAGDPLIGNNTYLLEKTYGWKGVSIEINSDLVDKFRNLRSNRILGADATKINYTKLLKESNYTNNHIDYLQLDCDPPGKTFEILLSIPFNLFKFGVITYEHDYYLDITKSYREKSRNYLQSLGYKMVIGNVSLDDSTPFEDWWVHPDIIDPNIIDKLITYNMFKTHNIEKYLFLN